MADKLKGAGYEFVNLDCGYSTKRRDSEGNLVVNATRYPNGMVWLGKKIHSLGLKFGMHVADLRTIFSAWDHFHALCAPNHSYAFEPDCCRASFLASVSIRSPPLCFCWFVLLFCSPTILTACIVGGGFSEPLAHCRYAAMGTSQCCSKIDKGATDGSEGYFTKDAELFASWGVDFLKFDGL
jgi:hypothetical protein